MLRWSVMRRTLPLGRMRRPTAGWPAKGAFSHRWGWSQAGENWAKRCPPCATGRSTAKRCSGSISGTLAGDAPLGDAGALGLDERAGDVQPVGHFEQHPALAAGVLGQAAAGTT